MALEVSGKISFALSEAALVSNCSAKMQKNGPYPSFVLAKSPTASGLEEQPKPWLKLRPALLKITPSRPLGKP